MTTKNYAEHQLVVHQILWQNLPDNKILIVPDDKPENMMWTKWQLLLKYVTLHNQENYCVCGKYLKQQGELHHAIFSRQDVRGNKYIREFGLIHHPFNVIVLCKDCHAIITRKTSAAYLSSIYKEINLRRWYDAFPMITNKINFDWLIESGDIL